MNSVVGLSITVNSTLFIIVPCTDNAGCQVSDSNKECSSGSCVCKTGYHSDNTGTCVLGKKLIIDLLVILDMIRTQ